MGSEPPISRTFTEGQGKQFVQISANPWQKKEMSELLSEG